jgi:hypothetical protein
VLTDLHKLKKVRVTKGTREKILSASALWHNLLINTTNSGQRAGSQLLSGSNEWGRAVGISPAPNSTCDARWRPDNAIPGPHGMPTMCM